MTKSFLAMMNSKGKRPMSWRIRKLREGLELGPTHFGDLLGVDVATIHRWEEGKYHPPLWPVNTILLALARARDRNPRVGKIALGYCVERGYAYALYYVLHEAFGLDGA
jgi:DNA-binding XRE family transcriptional regulator